MQCCHLFLTQAPRICAGYQRGTYNITIYDDNGVIFDHFGPTKYTQENSRERILIVKGLRSGLTLGSQYEVEVTVESLGIFRSQRKNFSKSETSCVILQMIPPLLHTHTHTHTHTHIHTRTHTQ